VPTGIGNDTPHSGRQETAAMPEQKVVTVQISADTAIEVMSHLAAFRSLVESSGLTALPGGVTMVDDSQKVTDDVRAAYLAAKVG
jgi:hypothetical protein